MNSRIDNQHKPFSSGDKFLSAVIVTSIVISVLISIPAIVVGVYRYTRADNAKDSVDDIVAQVSNDNVINSPCFTCDTETGDVTFNSTINMSFGKLLTIPHFIEDKDTYGLTGLTLPGYAFSNSPLSPHNGAPTFLGDLIQSVGSFTQQDVGLSSAAAPSGYTLTSANPNPLAFGEVFKSFVALGVGTVLKSEAQAVCLPSEMSPTPGFFFEIDDSEPERPIYPCICVGNHPSAGMGAGKHCASVNMTSAYF